MVTKVRIDELMQLLMMMREKSAYVDMIVEQPNTLKVRPHEDNDDSTTKETDFVIA